MAKLRSDKEERSEVDDVAEVGDVMMDAVVEESGDEEDDGG